MLIHSSLSEQLAKAQQSMPMLDEARLRTLGAFGRGSFNDAVENVTIEYDDILGAPILRYNLYVDEAEIRRFPDAEVKRRIEYLKFCTHGLLRTDDKTLRVTVRMRKKETWVEDGTEV